MKTERECIDTAAKFAKIASFVSDGARELNIGYDVCVQTAVQEAEEKQEGNFRFAGAIIDLFSHSF